MRSLNGEDLYIEYPGTVYMLVGGGPALFLVFACYDNRRFRTLARPEADREPPVELVTGGQRGVFPARHRRPRRPRGRRRLAMGIHGDAAGRADMGRRIVI